VPDNLHPAKLLLRRQIPKGNVCCQQVAGKKFIKLLCFSAVKDTELHMSLFKHTPNILHTELMKSKQENKNVTLPSMVESGLTKGGRTLGN